MRSCGWDHDYDLATHYAEHRLASYESVSLPRLPNHFMIFGPYGWTGGTWHQLVAAAARRASRTFPFEHYRFRTREDAVAP